MFMIVPLDLRNLDITFFICVIFDNAGKVFQEVVSAKVMNES